MYIRARRTCAPLLTFFASLSREPPGAEALSIDALSVAAAVGDLTLVVAQLALQTLPAGEAAALAVLIVAVAGAKHGADTWKKRGISGLW